MSLLALFDIDGTLVLTGGAGGRALARACHALHGWQEALAGVHLGGKTDPLIVDEIFARHAGRPARPDEFDALIDAYVGFLAEELAASEAYRVLPGVGAALASLEVRGATLGLATGNVAPAARLKLERGGLWAPFAFGGFGSDAGDRGQLVATAIARGEAHAGRCFAPDAVLVIGDTVRDIAAARACGAVAVAVATGFESLDTLRAASPDVLLATLAELPAHLSRWS